jgi:DNA-binding IscR family transcriptional regulator
VHISAKADYAVRALVELAAWGSDGYVTVDALAAKQGLPPKFL